MSSMKLFRIRCIPPAAVPAMLLLLSGCAAVGPDYTPPLNSAPAGWNTQLQDGLRPDPADP
jgi:hypothetical protein